MANIWMRSIPPDRADDPIKWMESHVRLIGSALSQQCDFSLTPWVKRPLLRAALGLGRINTHVKPVQSGGSAASEALACYWLSTEVGGFEFHWNWEDNKKADIRFEERIEKILKACKPLMTKLRAVYGTDKWKKGSIVSPFWNLKVQGVWEPKNVDSDSVRFEINEEIHNWEPGRLAKADNRMTAVWNAVQYNVSNAAKQGSQLHQKFLSGTQEPWEISCPHCARRHYMQTRWDPKRPDLGGLRYDADGCRLGDGQYNYTKLAPTIRFQMPCGGEVPDDRTIRRRMNLGADYGEPRNPGAPPRNFSYLMEAAAVDYIPWLTLVQEKHDALRALRLGDPEPWWRYLAERECRFYDPDEDRPVMSTITLNTKIKKNREGLPKRVARFGALDRQQGSLAKNELPHWWLVIRDFDALGNSLLVWEGKCLTDEDAVFQVSEHQVPPTCVVADSGHDTTHVYQFCLANGYNAIKGSAEAFFAHRDGGRRIFSEERPLHQMLNIPPTRDNPVAEPLFWHYSKAGILERLHWLRNSPEVKWEVPGDVSEAYRKHIDSMEYVTRKHPRTNEPITEAVFRRERFDLLVCEAYCAMLAEMSGLIGATQKLEKKK
jgi:hypothetical protein